MKRMLCGFLAVLLAAAVLSAGAEAKAKTDPVEWYTDFRCMMYVAEIEEGEVVLENWYDEAKKLWVITWQEYDGFSIILYGFTKDNLQVAAIISNTLDDAQLTAGTNYDTEFCRACIFAALSSYGPFDNSTMEDCFDTMKKAIGVCIVTEREMLQFTWEGISFTLMYEPDVHTWSMYMLTGT